MWPGLLFRPCSGLPVGRLYHPQTRRCAQPHGEFTARDLPKRVCGARIATSEWRKTQPICKQRRQCQARHSCHEFQGGITRTHFSMRIFYLFAPSYRQRKLAAVYKQHETQKRNEYSQRVREVERGTFTPLVLTTSGGMARETTTVYKRLASLLADKRREPYATVMGWVRCALSFCLLRSAIMCVRDIRRRQPSKDLMPESFDEATTSGRMPLD